MVGVAVQCTVEMVGFTVQCYWRDGRGCSTVLLLRWSELQYSVTMEVVGVAIQCHCRVSCGLCPDASIVLCLSYWTFAGKSTYGLSEALHWKSTRSVVTMMLSNDLVIGEDLLLGPSCQLFDCQTGRWGSMAFGSPPRRGKALISNPSVLRKYPLMENTSRNNQEWCP